jgi:hypothetical protein
MRTKILAIIIVTLTALGCGQMVGFARQSQSKCAQIKYAAPLIPSKVYLLSRIEGQVVYASPSQKWDSGSANGLCVTLFNRVSGGLVAESTTDDRGQFELTNVAPGEYVLIAFAGEALQINLPLRLVPYGKAGPPRRLLLHMREKEDRRKSYVSLVTNLALRKELLTLVEQDQNLRNDMIKSGVDHPDKAILARLDALDSQNTVRMRSIIKKFGWPGAELVGWDGTEAAFTLVQHAAHSLQKELLPLVKAKFKAGIIQGPNYALFLDRVLVDDGKPQVYGLKAKPFAQWKNGEPVLYPIADEANVDKRRAEVGLSSLAEYRLFLKRMYYPERK